MRIAVNTRLLIPGKLDGIGRFTYEVLGRIVKNHPEHTFYFIFDRKHNKDMVFSENVIPVELFPPTRHPLLWYFWLEFRIPKVLKKLKADLFLSTDGFLSLRSKVVAYNVIHDINFVHRPEDLPFITRQYYRYFYPKYAIKAKRIATVSEYSRRDIINSYNVPEDKIDLVYNAAGDNFFPISEEQGEIVRKKYTNSSHYFVFVGSLHPRKNIRNLLRAFELFREEYKSPFKLVLVGKKFYLNQQVETQLENMKYKSDVIFTGWLTQEELNQVIGASWALTFVPFFEGFGIPLVEAMNCDIPILTSNVTSLPEIAGDAAIYAAPESPGSIRDGMIRLVKEKGLREDLIKKGRERRSLYNWDNTARELWNSIEKCIMKNA